MRSNRRFSPIILLLTYAGCILVSDAIALQAKLTHLDLARILVRELRPEDTSYQHKQGYINWKGENGAENYQSHVDCSGLLNVLFERAYGITPNDFEKWLGKRRPLASEYFNAITQQQNFRAITSIGNVRPGDIIAIRYPPGTNDNTGHIMIVNEVPSPRKPSKPEVEGTQQWEVGVIDSSESGHGKTDTRRKPDGSFGDGVGQGILRIYTDHNNEIVGYTWSTFAVSDYYDQNTRQLVIGRLQLPLRLIVVVAADHSQSSPWFFRGIYQNAVGLSLTTQTPC